MRIANHDIQLSSGRESVSHHEVSERLVAWQGNNRIDMSRGERETSATVEGNLSRSVLLDISEAAMTRFMDAAADPKTASAKSPTVPTTDDEEAALPSELQYTKLLLEKFFGVKITLVKPGEAPGSEGAQAQTAQSIQSEQPEPPRQGWGISYSYHEMTYEKETVRFEAAGTVTTGDGREINFETKLEMSRETMERVDIELRAGDALIDPLVVNLDGKGVQLTDQKYAFDLDADGQNENISFVRQGSGFLVLDRNRNGVVDDGGELFGPTTGSGFRELEAHDADQNGWIDENDAIFFDLKVWTKEPEADRLVDLKAYDIGAVYLDNSSTTFDLEGGRVRDTGIYLREGGETGFIQEVDLVAG